MRIFRVDLFGGVNALAGAATILRDDVLLAGPELEQISRVRFLGFVRGGGRRFRGFLRLRRGRVDHEDRLEHLAQVGGKVGLQLVRDAGDAHEQTVQQVLRGFELYPSSRPNGHRYFLRRIRVTSTASTACAAASPTSTAASSTVHAAAAGHW